MKTDQILESEKPFLGLRFRIVVVLVDLLVLDTTDEHIARFLLRFLAGGALLGGLAASVLGRSIVVSPAQGKETYER